MATANKKTDIKTTKPKGTTTSSASSTKSTKPAKSTAAKPTKTTPSKPAKTTTKASTGAAASKSSSSKSSSKGSSSQSTTDKAKEVASKATSKAKGAAAGKGKILAATAGVAAAAAAAGVAYFRGTRGSSAKDDGRNVYHILPGDEGWQVKGAGDGSAVSSHSTKKEALSAARDLAHSKVPSQLVVHKSDGTIQESWSYDAEAN